jgi:hypothetical protein
MGYAAVTDQFRGPRLRLALQWGPTIAFPITARLRSAIEFMMELTDQKKELLSAILSGVV